MGSHTYAALRYAETPDAHLRRANLQPDRSWYASREAYTKPPVKPAPVVTASSKGKAATSSGGGNGLLHMFSEATFMFIGSTAAPQRPVFLTGKRKDELDEAYTFGT